MQGYRSQNPFIVLLRVGLAGGCAICGLVGVQFARGGAGLKAAESIGIGLACFAVLSVIERLTTGRWHRWQRR